MTESENANHHDKEEIDELFRKMKRIINDEQELTLSQKEIRKMQEMISIYESFQAFGRFATVARNLVIFAGSLIAAWFFLSDHIVAALKRLVSGS